jgi:poly-gamma-glutamate synthesis protein (capsule biosynthesis protein)
MRRIAVGIVLLTFALVSVACGSGDGDESPATATSTVPVATSTAVASVAAPATTAAATGTPPPAASGASITISAVGDISLAREVNDRMAAGGAGYPYALIKELLVGDIVIGNLEGALTDRGEPWPKGYNFRTPPMFAPGLGAAGFDLVSLANNHTMDYDEIGLLDTLSALDAAGVRHVGAGTDEVTARTPVILEASGLRVAFLGYVATPDEGGGFSIRQWDAGPGKPGLVYGSDAAITADVAAARTMADFVVVLVHAGSEYVNAPDATQRRIVATALAAGADAYIGAHAHVVQPIEQRGSQLVAWGLGNFIFDLDNVDLANIPEPRVSLILNFTLTKGAGVTSFEAVPVTQDAAEDRPRPATPAEAAVLFDLIEP